MENTKLDTEGLPCPRHTQTFFQNEEVFTLLHSNCSHLCTLELSEGFYKLSYYLAVTACHESKTFSWEHYEERQH